MAGSIAISGPQIGLDARPECCRQLRTDIRDLLATLKAATIRNASAGRRMVCPTVNTARA